MGKCRAPGAIPSHFPQRRRHTHLIGTENQLLDQGAGLLCPKMSSQCLESSLAYRPHNHRSVSQVGPFGCTTLHPSAALGGGCCRRAAPDPTAPYLLTAPLDSSPIPPRTYCPWEEKSIMAN